MVISVQVKESEGPSNSGFKPGISFISAANTIFFFFRCFISESVLTNMQAKD